MAPSGSSQAMAWPVTATRSAFVLLHIMNYFPPPFLVPERMAMEMLMEVIACPGLERGTRQGTVRGSVA